MSERERSDGRWVPTELRPDMIHPNARVIIPLEPDIAVCRFIPHECITDPTKHVWVVPSEYDELIDAWSAPRPNAIPFCAVCGRTPEAAP